MSQVSPAIRTPSGAGLSFERVATAARRALDVEQEDVGLLVLLGGVVADGDAQLCAHGQRRCEGSELEALVADIAKVKMKEVLREMLPFYVPLLITLMLITYVPAITTWLPRWAIGQP